MSGNEQLHLPNCWSLDKYSCDQLCHRWRVNTWQKCQHHNDDVGLNGSARSGNTSKCSPIRKWPDVRTLLPYSGWGILPPEPVSWQTLRMWDGRRQWYTRNGASGYLLPLPKAHQSVEHVQEQNSTQWMPWSAQSLSIANSIWAFPRCVQWSLSSLAASMNFVPWSLQIIIGIPHRAMNLCRHAMKLVVVSFDTTLGVLHWRWMIQKCTRRLLWSLASEQDHFWPLYAQCNPPLPCQMPALDLSCHEEVAATAAGEVGLPHVCKLRNHKW